jgi:uncharacterized protein (TIGR03083 family)
MMPAYTGNPPEETVAVIDERAAAFRESLGRSDPQAPVPTCPDWTVADLAGHLAGVHRSWSAAILAGSATARPPREEMPDLDTPDALIAWSAESTRQLIDALRATPPDRECWAWWPPTAAPRTVARAAQHLVQETAVHAYDAAVAASAPEPVPAPAAVIGIPHFLQAVLGTLPPWPHRPARINFAAVEGPAWLVDLTPTAVTLDPSAAGHPLLTLRGTSSDLLLWLHNRVPLSTLTIEGDESAITELRSWLDQRS